MRAQSLAVHSLTVALTTFWLSGCVDRDGLDLDPPTGGASGTGATQGTGGAPGTGGRQGTGGGGPGTGGGMGGRGGRGGSGGVAGAGGTVACPAVCAIFCQYGNVLDANGCATCRCNPPPTPCPAIACGNMCPGGYATDPMTGCSTCACKPVCQALPCAACTYGSYTDANGCATCMCKPAPATCSREECGTPPPTVTAPIICAGSAAGPAGAASSPTAPGADAIAIAPGAVCRRNADGKCSWTVNGSCCTGAACDIYCPYGNQVDGNGCATCACNPPPTTCAINACGPLPATPVVCGVMSGAGGSTGAPVAGAPADRPLRLVCQASAAGACTWQPVPGCRFCPQVACRLACPNGFRADPSGCQTCECNPTPMADCSRYGDYASCSSSMACTWLTPGCGDPALAAAGCYPRDSIGCTSDSDCDAGHQCLKRIVNPCAGFTSGAGANGGGSGISACAACGQSITICQ